VDRVVDKKGTRDVAQAYLEFLYMPAAQRIIGDNFYRPRDAAIAATFSERFPQLEMVTIKDFGGWPAAQAKYFADGGMFDRIFTPGR
jgi:sulfate transport system substrate-binding protein